jgi:predicted GNAT family acetyltransferase
MDVMKKDPMPTGERQLGPAVCRVRRCAALPAKMQDVMREIHRLVVPDNVRHQGYGTTLMHRVCREADAAGITLVLFVGAFGREEDMDNDALLKWYTEQFGFVVLQTKTDNTDMMLARMPGSTPRVLSMNPVARAIVHSTQKVAQ